MASPKTLRSGYAVLLGTSLAACLGVPVGCNVYDEELLRRPDDTGGPYRDAAGGSDAASSDGARPLDIAAPDAGDASALDATLTDAARDRGAGPATDAYAPDGAPADTGATRADADTDAASSDGAPGDTNGINDIVDAHFDATTGSRDGDGAAPMPDANDAADDGGSRADGNANDGPSRAPDATIDADGGSPPPTFRVVRVGDGTTSLSGASSAAFIEERRWDGTLVGSALSLPTASAGSHNPLTLAGIATSEGALALSLDGHYLTVAGYATAPGRASVASSTDVDRVIARIDASGTVDSSTRLGDAFSGSNVRSAASMDGASFWVGGSASGVWYVALGGSGREQIVATPDNVRLVALFGDQLYGSSGASPMTSVFTVGNGRPTTGVQKAAALAGMPRSGMSPYAFAFFDLDRAVPGLDTLYLTDDRSPESDGSGGGIQKWTLDGSAWSRVATFAAVGGGSASFRGLAAAATSTGVALVASTSEASGNRLVVFVDDGSPGVTGTVVATAPSNTIFRGVALSPHP
jgi:hypothetical protein